jgi:hypothetical protein
MKALSPLLGHLSNWLLHPQSYPPYFHSVLFLFFLGILDVVRPVPPQALDEHSFTNGMSLSRYEPNDPGWRKVSYTVYSLDWPVSSLALKCQS